MRVIPIVVALRQSKCYGTRNGIMRGLLAGRQSTHRTAIQGLDFQRNSAKSLFEVKFIRAVRGWK